MKNEKENRKTIIDLLLKLLCENKTFCQKLIMTILIMIFLLALVVLVGYLKMGVISLTGLGAYRLSLLLKGRSP